MDFVDLWRSGRIRSLHLMRIASCKTYSLHPQWFRVLGASFSRFWGLRFRSRALRFRDLGASFSSLGCFVFDLGCFVFEFRVLRFRDLGASFSSFGCFVLRSSFSSASFSKLPYYDGQLKNVQNLSDENVVIFFLFWVDSATNLLSSANSTNLPTCCLCSGLVFFLYSCLLKFIN